MSLLWKWRGGGGGGGGDLIKLVPFLLLPEEEDKMLGGEGYNIEDNS